MPNTRPRQPAAFTLAEMLVVMAIMVLLVTMIHQIFNQASQAVRLGLATQTVVNTSRTISQQLVEDASRMVGPAKTGGGVLIILQHEIEAPLVQLEGARTVEYHRPVRSDQLVFIADATGWEPKTPGSEYSFVNYARARYARIWYGHGLRTSPDGGYTTPLGYGQPGQPAYNRLANRWILARQAAFLAGVQQSSQQPTGTTIYVNHWLFGTAEEISAPPSYLSHFPPSPPRFFHGLTDVSNWSLANLQSLSEPLSYLAFATGPTRRLWVNPNPFRDSINNPAQQSLLPRQAAQMHGLLAENVSDFIVEFAGDLNNDGQIDTGGGFPAGTDNFGRKYGPISEGYIKWYAHENFANSPESDNYNSRRPLVFQIDTDTSSYDPNPQQTTQNPNFQAQAAFVWRHDDDSKWPYLIRIRYRLHDSDGRLTSGYDTPDSGRWFEQIIKVNRP